MTGSLGRRYARALLSLAREESRLDETGADLERVAAAFADPQLQRLLANPAVAASVRDQLVERVGAALGVSRTVSQTLRLLARRDRLDIVADVARAYGDLLDRELGRTRVTIRSAVPLSSAQQQALEALARKLANTDVLVSAEVSPDLIGGAVLDVGGVVYDGSIQTQLTRMARAMTAGGR